MEPFCRSNGDLLVFDRFSHRWAGWKRGDVVIAIPPHNPHYRVCKRVVALPGEAVEVEMTFDDASMMQQCFPELPRSTGFESREPREGETWKKGDRNAMCLMPGSKQILSITANAAKRLRHLLNKKSDPSVVGIRVGLARKGCENMSYTMNYTNSVDKFDEVVESKEVDPPVKVVVDSKAVMYLVGTEMDFEQDDVTQEFVFNNPNTKSSCGCGKSFSV